MLHYIQIIYILCRINNNPREVGTLKEAGESRAAWQTNEGRDSGLCHASLKPQALRLASKTVGLIKEGLRSHAPSSPSHAVYCDARHMHRIHSQRRQQTMFWSPHTMLVIQVMFPLIESSENWWNFPAISLKRNVSLNVRRITLSCLWKQAPLVLKNVSKNEKRGENTELSFG